MNTFGYVLGRFPSEPDERDWRLEAFQTGNPLDAALEVLLKSRAALATKAWAKIATAQLDALPAPTPAPVPPAPPSGLVVWTDAEEVFDQGQFGTCVGNGWAQWGNTLPVDDKFIEADARAIYHEATCIDGQCDDTYQNGSSVRSGAKAMQARKRLANYAFASSTDAIIKALASQSVVAGTDWLKEMFTPDANGIVKPSGAVEGGHCYLLDKYVPAGVATPEGKVLSTSEDFFGIENSWGRGWALGGYAYIAVADFAQLLAGNGEACAAVELPLA